MNISFTCPLCSSPVTLFQTVREKEYYQCAHCSSVALHPHFYVSSQEEKERYLEHNNDINDKGYQQFVSPIVNAVVQNHGSMEVGLDYGSGTGPVITKQLKEKNYNIITYDPIFNKSEHALKKIYDYIVCCEVIEHFHHPYEEFEGFRRILKPGGMLYIMTFLIDEHVDFKTWHYKDDQTHVFFYHKDALQWIVLQFGFKKVEFNDRLITLYG